MAKPKKRTVKFLVSGQVVWASRNGKETSARINEGDVMMLRVEDNFMGGYELWDGNASIIMDKDKVEIIG